MKVNFEKRLPASLLGGLMILTGAFTSCQKTDFDDGANPEQSKLTVEKAKSAFEAELLSYDGGVDLLGMTSNLSESWWNHNSGLPPGEFTPLWDYAGLDQGSNMQIVQVPIISEYVHFATRYFNESKETVPVFQKLTMILYENSPEKVQTAILSIIPTSDYYSSNWDIDETFCYGMEVGDFSGLVSLRALNGDLISLEKYENGILIDDVNSTNFPKDYNEYIDRFSEIAGEISYTRILTSAVYTRIDEPDFFSGELSNPEIQKILNGLRNSGFNGTFSIESSVYGGTQTASNIQVGSSYSIARMNVNHTPNNTFTNHPAINFSTLNGYPCTTYAYPNSTGAMNFTVTVYDGHRDAYERSTGLRR